MRIKKTNLFLSIATVACATALLVGSTYAIFTDGKTVNNHIAAGSLSVGLHRVGLQKNEIQNDGTLKVGDLDATDVDLGTDGSSLFTFDNAAPTTWQEATLQVSNLGTVAFDYGVKMIWNEDGTATDLQTTFAEQIKITVSYGTEYATVKSYLLKDAATNSLDLGSILANAEAQTFKIKSEFIDDAANNDVMRIDLDFDMQLFATQKIK